MIDKCARSCASNATWRGIVYNNEDIAPTTLKVFERYYFLTGLCAEGKQQILIEADTGWGDFSFHFLIVLNGFSYSQTGISFDKSIMHTVVGSIKVRKLRLHAIPTILTRRPWLLHC